ncbi:hypothetical protein T01_3678 [Trichinella spiralis]|uniref:Uncharacterized protein n=1 Tax=Trichinella spiralis TaxID=6334 RepID=A0A0V1B7P3_TRISP|nr:hypothetical protein T01_3678 [Trichinella spiralis]
MVEYSSAKTRDSGGVRSWWAISGVLFFCARCNKHLERLLDIPFINYSHCFGRNGADCGGLWIAAGVVGVSVIKESAHLAEKVMAHLRPAPSIYISQRSSELESSVVRCVVVFALGLCSLLSTECVSVACICIEQRSVYLFEFA